MRALIFLIGLLVLSCIIGCVRPIDVVNANQRNAPTSSEAQPPQIEESASQFLAADRSVPDTKAGTTTDEKPQQELPPRQATENVAESDSPKSKTQTIVAKKPVVAQSDAAISEQPKQKVGTQNRATQKPAAQNAAEKSGYANVPFPISKPLNRRVPMPRDNEEEKTPFQKLDVNQDGKLSGVEIPEPLSNLIPEIDADKDDAITQDELRAFLQR